ncbi:MAP kinase-activated protein kinase 5 isoform 2-T2 [Pangshura tecta]
MSEDHEMDKMIKETSILEEYSINWTQKLGAGISGPVRVCVKKSTQERFALKILLDRPKARNEVRLHMMCATHPNIVQIIEVYANSVQFPHESSPRARLLIVMEMMEGGELFHRISQHRHFTEKQASQVTKQIALALQHCHTLNIAHRDLKPENLLFKDNSLDAPVKLCDFGFAKIDQGDLMTPQFTPYYVAPQVLEAQRRHQKEKSGIIPTSPTPYTYNKSCDLWSLGVIIYVMLCGYPPFYSKHHSRTIPKDMRKKIMTGSFEFPEEEWSQISEMAKDIVRKLLKVKPEERLTIEGVLDHPWLNSTEALDNILPSSQMMMDKAMVAGIQQAHAEQLANMRIQDLKVSLKPLHSVNNPILRKRKLLGPQLGYCHKNPAWPARSSPPLPPAFAYAFLASVTRGSGLACPYRYLVSAESEQPGSLCWRGQEEGPGPTGVAAPARPVSGEGPWVPAAPCTPWIQAGCPPGLEPRG